MMMADMPFWDFGDEKPAGRNPKNIKKVGTYLNSEGAVCDEFDMDDFKRAFKL